MLEEGNLTSLEDWITSEYIENGTKFYVVQPKGYSGRRQGRFPGAFEALSRDGRYLLPHNVIHNNVVFHCQTQEMFEKQRRHVRFRRDDVVVTTYPRSGTTWMEQVVLLILSKGNAADLDTSVKNAYNPRQPSRMGKVFLDVLFHNRQEGIALPWGHLLGQDTPMTPAEFDGIPFRRVLKTHYRTGMLVGMGEAKEELQAGLPPPFTVDGVKFIFVIRDPKDIACSLYHVNFCNLEKHGMPFTAFVKLFLEGKVITSGDWVQYTREWLALAARHPDNFLVIAYEDMSADAVGATRRIAEFLGETLTEEEVLKCVKHSSFACMKENSKKSTVEHVHQGIVGAGKLKMTSEMVDAFDALVNDASLGSYGQRYVTKKRQLTNA